MGAWPSWLAVLRQPVKTDANNTDALVNFLNSKDGKAKHTDATHIIKHLPTTKILKNKRGMLSA